MNANQSLSSAVVVMSTAFVLLSAAPLAADSIWIEGERPDKADVTKHGWYDDVRKDGMSGGDWLSHYDRRRPGTATYRFSVDEPGAYTFWWRGNVLLSEVSYALDDGEFTPMSLKDKRGEYMVSPRPDHRSLAWVKVGGLRLAQGEHALRIKFHSKLANHGGTDCLLIDNTGFVPSGVRRPGDESEAGPADWFSVAFDVDKFSPESAIDMSAYVEAPAGKHGFLKRDGAALRFERSDAPVKFWGCGANAQVGRFTREQQTDRIRYLRKHGVNMVRQHPLFAEIGPLRDGGFNPERLDEFDWYFAELKRHGIYMTWSVFYPLLIDMEDGYEPELFAELESRGSLRSTAGLVNIEPKLQDLQWRYVKRLLLHENPYTGLRYVDDPAFAVLETHNEESIFWHAPLNDLREGKKWPQHSRRLRQRWFEWVKRRYGTVEKVRTAWGRLRPGDRWERGELELMGAFHLGGEGPLYEFAGETRRAGDYIRFLAELQRGFYERRERRLRELGFRGATVTTAWRAGGPAADPANLWCDTAADMIDRHNYFGGGAGRHSIAEGNVNNQSHLPNPGGGLLSIGLYQVAGRPFSCTEWTQSPPNQWKLEAAPLIAFYGMGLQGWDASYHFTSSRPSLGDGWPNLNSYVTDTPHYIGQFPALFFALRHGHIQEGPVIAARKVRREDLFQGTDPLEQEFGGGHDVKTLDDAAGTPPAALAIGRVTVDLEVDQTDVTPPAARLEAYWDRRGKTIRSATGQLEWDYGRQVVTLEAEKSQAIVGRAAGRTFRLPGVTATVETPFVSLLFTPLDDRPLAASRQILITALARDKQTGTQYSPDGNELEVIGGPPLLMEPMQAELQLAGPRPKQINVLDVYGVRTGITVPTSEDGRFTIDGRYRTYYYEVVR